METLKDIRECYMQDQYFKLMGYDFVVPAGRNAYNQLRKKYHTLASQAQQRFMECERDFATIDDLLDGAVDALCYSLEDTLKAAVSDCVSIGVYDIDTENMLAICENKGGIKSFLEAYQYFLKGANTIRARLKYNAAQRDYQKATRPRWQITTFGGSMMDAWGNQMKANAMNAVGGAGASVKNAFVAAADEAEADKQLKALLNNQQYRTALRNGVYIAAFMLHIYLFGETFPSGSLVTDRETQNAISLCNNAVSLQISEQQQAEMVHRSLKMSPYIADNYMKFIQRFPQYRADFAALARYCGMTAVVQQLAAQVTDYVKEHLGTTEADAKACRSNTIDLVKRLGLVPNDCADAFQLLNVQDAKLDQEYRTVKGVVLNTRQAADNARQDLANYAHILEDAPNFLTRGDYLFHLQTIEGLAMDPNVKRVYLQKFQAQLADFDKKGRKAKRFDHILSHGGLPFKNGDKNDQLLHYGGLILMSLLVLPTVVEAAGTFLIWMLFYIAYVVYMFIIKINLEKDVYLKMTHNGQYSLEQILSDKRGEELSPGDASAASAAVAYKPHILVIIGVVVLCVFTLLVGAIKYAAPNEGRLSGSTASRYSSSRYESQEAFDQLAKAMRGSDAKAIMAVFLPDDVVRDLTPGDYANTQEQLEYAKIFATSQTVTFVVTAETALDDATLRSIEESYLMTFGQQVEIKRGYLSTVQVDAYGTQKTANVQAVYIKGDGWKIPIESAEAIWSRG